MFGELKIFLKEHLVGIIISILVGLVVALPPVIFRFSKDYNGLEMLKTNTESHYVAEVQEIYDGDPLIRNPFFKDLKDTPYLFPPLSPNIIALIGKMFFLNAIHAVMLARFLSVSLLAFFVYYFGFLTTKNKLVGYVCAPFVILGYTLLDPKNLNILFLRGIGKSELTFIDYGRPVNPQFSTLFFFAYLVCFWKFLFEDGRKKMYGILSAVILGLSFYVYLFTWTFIFSLNGFLCLIYLIKKDWKKFKMILCVSLGAVLLGIPYFVNTIIASKHEWYRESATRFGFVHSRDINLSRVVFGVLILFAFGYKKMSQKTRLFFLAFFGTAIFVANEQVITGLYVFNHHYHWYYSTPLIIICLVSIIYIFLQRFFSQKKYIINLATIFLVALFFYNGILIQYISYRSVLPVLIEEQRYAPVMDWLNNETTKESAIYSSYELMRVIPAFTHSNVYYHGTGIYSLVSDERLAHAYLAEVYLNNISAQDIDVYLNDHQPDIVGYVAGYRYAFQKGVCSSCAPSETVNALAQKYKGISDENFIEFLKEYPVDYFIWDKKINPNWNLDRFKMEEIKDFGELIVYRID